VFTTFAAGDAVVYRDRHTFISPDGTIYRETPGTYKDAGLLASPADFFVSLKVKTGWLNMAALQGFQRLWRVLLLGDYHSAHRLNCRIEYDYDEYDYEDALVPVTTVADSGVARTQQPYQHEFGPAKQKCEAVRLTFYDSESSTKGQSMSLSAITLLVGAKRGAMKLPASKRLT
jgi:hypothetical protein